MLRVAVFIDAGYLWKQLGKALFPGEERYRRANVHFIYPKFHAVLTDYVRDSFPGIPLLRCYWYDAPLVDGTLSSEHNKIALLNDFKLRLGSRVLEMSEGRTRQKGVDGLLTADLIALAQNRVLSHALLVSGDGDMVPGVGVAQALGMRIHLLAIHAESATSPQLRMEADFFDSWQMDTINAFAEPRTLSEFIPARIIAPAPDLSRSGTEDAQEAAPEDAEDVVQNMPEIAEAAPTESAPQPTAPPADEDEAAEAPSDADPVAAFFDSLTEEEKRAVTPFNIPHDIDRRLIRIAYVANGHKALIEAEKRAVREKLREHADQFRQG